ncbi:hypothetical protein CLF_107259 [Clonorchis sinensis]|uniref:Uncharacterized protein n=1 Tax=Clonorchis sinensis TaxID=79923 RepID=G7YGG0_CLOSI|nr:hypothetical protein CLF_107259 [Clonorchis sinensis]
MQLCCFGILIAWRKHLTAFSVPLLFRHTGTSYDCDPCSLRDHCSTHARHHIHLIPSDPELGCDGFFNYRLPTECGILRRKHDGWDAFKFPKPRQLSLGFHELDYLTPVPEKPGRMESPAGFITMNWSVTEAFMTYRADDALDAWLPLSSRFCLTYLEMLTASVLEGTRWFQWLEREFTDRKVYPSAARTDARRRNRLAESHSWVVGQTDTRHNRGDLTCPSKSTALPPKFNRAARSRDDQLCTRGGKCDIWLSEYNRQFPVYPTSVYTRSASIAAGRCRPLSGQLSSRNAQPSLVATHPVLLSSRKVGAVVGTNQSNICSCNG